MKKIITILLCILCPFAIEAQETEFRNEAALSGLEFKMPQGYEVTKVKENSDLHYSFAIVNPDGTMEVRYSIFPLKPLLDEYEKSKSDPNFTMINPNKIYIGIMMSNGLNMTGGKMVEVGDFPTDAVKQEFNADYGGSGFFEFNCEFGKGYKYGQFVCLHKENVADVIITFMSNDKTTHSDLMEIPFHALRFKR